MGTAVHDAKLDESLCGQCPAERRTLAMMHASYATTIAMENTALVWLSWTTCAWVWWDVQSQQGCPVGGVTLKNQMLSLKITRW